MGDSYSAFKGYVDPETNDSWPYYENIGVTEDQLCSFRPALAYLFDQLKSLYPQATLLFVLDTRLGLDAPLYVSEEHSGAFVSSIREIAAHYDIACIDVYDIPKEWGHPNVDGQKSIADQVIAFVETLF